MDENHPLLHLLQPRALPARAWRRFALLGAEGLALGAISIAITHLLGMAQEGTLSLFLLAAATSERFNGLLDENRDNVWQKRLPSREANRVTALSILALFLGMMLAFAGAALLHTDAELSSRFRFALEAANLGESTILTRRFPSLPALVAHNGAVWLTVAALSFLYRSYGALLALGWNACVWGVVFTTLIRRGAEGASLAVAGVSVLAVLPHLVLEAAAYVTACLGGIYLSKGLVKYDAGDGRFKQVGLAVLKLWAISLAILVAAGAVESVLPERILAAVR